MVGRETQSQKEGDRENEAEKERERKWIQRAWRNYKRRKEHTGGTSKATSSGSDDDDDDDNDDNDNEDMNNGDKNIEDNNDDDNDELLSNDVNGNQLPGESDIHSSQIDQQRETNQSVEGEGDNQHQDSTSSGGESQTEPIAMTAVGGSKKGIAMLHDLGSSVELDDKACYETSPDTPSRRRQGINRLSLAEELAAMEERIMEDSVDFDSQNEESDYYASSSCVTSPEGDGGDGNEHIGKRPVVSLSRNIGGKQTPSPSEMRTTEGSPHIESFDQNKNTNDFNANASSFLMEETELSEALAKLKTKLGTAYMDNDTPSSTLNPISGEQSINRVGETTPSQSKPVTHSMTSSVLCSTTTLTHTSSIPVHSSTDITSAAVTTSVATTTTCNRGTNTQTLVTSTATTAPCSNSDPSLVGKRLKREGGAPPRGGVCKSLSGIDTALPVLDWDSLEKHLAKMEREEEQQQSAKQSQKNSRQEILRKLAMGADEEAEGDIYGKGRDKLSARLQGGMNLQICFVNENLDSDDDEGSKVVAMPSSSTIPGPIVGNRDSRYLFSRECSASSTSSGASPKAPSVTFEDIEDFESKKAQLQEEARIAWAKAEPLAKLQMELERQQRKTSPSSVLCHLSGLGDLPISLLGKRFQYKTLSRMSVSKLQIILNDLHSQVERLNEELVQCLLARDSYKREQESRLIDIEDLNRWIRMNLQQNNNSTLISKESLGDDGRKQRHQYEALLRLLGNTLPASGKKCFCGVSRSSSVVSNRSASSPEPDTIGGIRPAPLSPISPGSCRSESAVNSLTESHASSPEMTWVRQAIVRYWHN
ncbi:dentin sialophosphoprotein-like [Lytechinus pictus]|uniref:dentin sialophosphoprotein-like n=1 Tax=Lytechinus pictus TaxID=7653 RepID=UPI0030B9EFCA